MVLKLMQPRIVYATALIVLAFATGCVTTPPTAASADDCDTVDAAAANPALDRMVEQLDGKQFRSLPYLQLAAALQSLPRAQAENQLRAWACSQKHGFQVICLCRLLFVAPDGQPLARPPHEDWFAYPNKEGSASYINPKMKVWAVGSTYNTDWPDWPLAIVDGVPFCISAEPVPLDMIIDEDGIAHAPSSKPPPWLPPLYLEYCLKEGRWTGKQYQVAELEARTKALQTLLTSSLWKRNLRQDEIVYLTYQTKETADTVEPKEPGWP